MSDNALARLTAAIADRYRIERELGAGGMATVYLAHDLRHDRKVALKVLRPELSAILGAERFLGEIKTTAHLQHPHILSLFDSGEAEGLVYYVMPFVEGESLRDRLVREHQLPVNDAVRIAREVADALAYAHAHGIIHRDIKPENILLHGGHAMVADFGIALAASSTAGTRMTETGMSLGTPHYMAPEQAMGEREITAKADIYALGCVLYEMLTAEPPFSGATAQAIIARVMTEEPRSLTLQRRTIPPHVEAAVMTALAKLPADRFATASEFIAALDNTTPARARAFAAEPQPRRKGATAALAGLSLVAVAAIAVAAWEAGKSPSPAMVSRFELVIPDTLQGRTTLAVTQDGRKVILASKGRLWLRPVDAIGLTPIPGVEGARRPFTSPDGGEVGYLQQTAVKLAPITGGPSRTVADSANQASWGADGQIYFTWRNRLLRVPAKGGSPEQLYAAPQGSVVYCPDPLPGGRGVLFTESAGQASEVHVLDLKSRAGRSLERGGCARFSPTGFITFGRDQFLLAARFDPGRLALASTAVPVVEGADPESFAVGGGTLVYPQQVSTTQLPVVVDRGGRMRTLTNLPAELGFSFPRVSPDGRQVAFRVVDKTGATNIWVYTFPSGPLTRLTFAGTDLDDPNWTPDGTRVSFGATRDGKRSLYLQRADGSAEPELLLRRKAPLWTQQWLPDGKRFIFSEGEEVVALGMGWLGQPDSAVMLLASTASQRHPTLSPGGNFLAYDSNESGRTEVYIRAVEGPGRWQVSTEGGYEPRWSRKGGEIFFRNGDSVYTAAVDTRQGVVVHGVTSLFSTRLLPAVWYDVFPADTAFMMIRSSEALGAHPPIIVVNFPSEFDRKLPR